MALVAQVRVRCYEQSLIACTSRRTLVLLYSEVLDSNWGLRPVRMPLGLTSRRSPVDLIRL